MHVFIFLQLIFFILNSIDATNDDGSFGRLVNDSADPNCKMKKIFVNGTPHLCLFAIKDIKRDDEITYDYGGDNLTWRATLQKVRT